MEEQPDSRASTLESASPIEPFARELRLPLSIGFLPSIEVTIPAYEAEGMRTSLLERFDSVAHRTVPRAVHRKHLPHISTANDCDSVSRDDGQPLRDS
jgi:hypothetical protein